MKKKTPITISELDVQPISDEDLSEYVFGQAGSSDVCECCEGSDVIICYGNADQ
jgi:hypothetical protein